MVFAELFEMMAHDPMAHDPIDELDAAEDADDLCRLLLESAWGWGHSTRPAEAVALLRVHGTGELPASFVALLLCTCKRWYACTARLITAVEDSGLLTSAELDELAGSFLTEEIVIDYPIGWARPDWVDVVVDDGAGNAHTIGGDTSCRETRRPEPPLRRWAATHTLRANPEQFTEILAFVGSLDDPRHRDAVIGGLLDSADVLQLDERRELVRHGLRCGTAPARRRALDRLAELDGPDPARRRARADPNARVRAWRPAKPAVAQRRRPPVGAP